ncbi:aminotransferase class IV [Xanthomarina spongicola]|uniref:branched-chain-amino-acid transaminase n=1 Tax=Xanthomarina spongicola TaxID=570520 RepID=A0A316DLF8_9FLAO|nr:aminotransferase class IV [Xanthomarina spongicola]PWK18546.1 branched-chain amino acid aminotransferase [Xanthomarina spongicola]
MVNFNGNILEEEHAISINNRGLNYGDALFETIKATHGKLLFWEDHYFRLMASMRILRMEIPMSFTMEFLNEQIVELLNRNNLLNKTVRVKLFINRKEGGLYLPDTNNVDYLITVKPLESDFYLLDETTCQVDLFKDYFVSPSLLSTLKTNNKVLHVVGSIFAKENNLQNCFVLNTDKHVVEALNGNIFIVKDHVIKTPPLEDGCLKGIMRKQIIEIIQSMPEYSLEESSISPFELQKADEIFITNVIVGIQPVTGYRKKIYKNELSKGLLQKLNVKIRLTN